MEKIIKTKNKKSKEKYGFAFAGKYFNICVSKNSTKDMLSISIFLICMIVGESLDLGWYICLAQGLIDFGGPYSIIELVDDVNIIPLNGNFTDCYTDDVLPNGLVLEKTTCTIMGIPISLDYDSIIQVVSSHPYSTGSVVISTHKCSSNAFEILRTYGNSNVVFEEFSVIDYHLGHVFLNVTVDTPKKSGSVVSYRFCHSVRYLRVNIGSNVYKNWYVGSKLSVYYLSSYSRYKDHLLSCRMDETAGMPSSFIVDIMYLFQLYSEWKYHMNDYPKDWERSKHISSWQSGRTDTFPISTNHIQIYKLSFLPLEFISGAYELTIRYQHGCIVYVNGIEVYRDHLPIGVLLNTTVATRSEKSPLYHSTVLPSFTYINGKWTSLLIKDNNIITIALIGVLLDERFNGNFDASMRFTGDASQYRSYGLEGHVYGLEGVGSDVIDVNHETYVEMVGTCNLSSSIVLQYNHTHHEAVSLITLTSFFHDFIPGPSGFSLHGRVADDLPWEPIAQFDSILWTTKAQKQQFWIQSTRAFNAYRFSQFKSDLEQCNWRLSEIMFFTEKFDRQIIPLVYSPLSVYAFMIVNPLLPSTSDYYNYSIRPSLPLGLKMDRLTGIVQGTPTIVTPLTTYSVTATCFTGNIIIVPWLITISSCSKAHSFYTVDIIMPKQNSNSYWEIYRGSSTIGTPLFHSGFITSEVSSHRWTFCLEDDMYSLFFVETSGAGWNTPSGYTVSTNINSFSIATGTLPRLAPQQSWSNSTVHLYTNQPVQPRTSVWHICGDCEPKTSWTSLLYNDHDWLEHFTSYLPIAPHTSPTFYLRRRFSIEDLTHFTAMLLQIQFTGGLAIYFNGYRVFLVNLPTTMSSRTYAFTDHPFSKRSQVMIPLRAVGGKDGENVIAAELHSAQGSSQPHDFDCITQLLNDEVAIITASYSSLTSSPPYSAHSGTIDNLFDGLAHTFFRPIFQVGTFYQWTMENDEQPFNGYLILPSNRIMNHSWSLSGRFRSSDDWIMIDLQINQTISDRIPFIIEVPHAMARFKEFRYEVLYEYNVSVFSMMEFFLLYTSSLPYDHCPTTNRYVAVKNGQYGYACCPYGYQGITSQLCSDYQWGPEDRSFCLLSPPSSLHYPITSIRIPTNFAMNPLIATYFGIISKFYSSPALPTGLILTEDGQLYGAAIESIASTQFTIIAENNAGNSSAVLTMVIYDRFCSMNSLCTKSKVGELCYVQCQSELTNTVGTRYKECMASGMEHGDWGDSKGRCVPVGIVIGIVFSIMTLVIFLIAACTSLIAKARNTIRRRVIFDCELRGEGRRFI